MQTAILESRSTTAKPAEKKRSAPSLMWPIDCWDCWGPATGSEHYSDLTRALTSIGHAPPADACDFCLPIDVLAPKEHLKGAHEELKAQIISAAALTNPHCYEAGQLVPHLLRKWGIKVFLRVGTAP